MAYENLRGGAATSGVGISSPNYTPQASSATGTAPAAPKTIVDQTQLGARTQESNQPAIDAWKQQIQAIKNKYLPILAIPGLDPATKAQLQQQQQQEIDALGPQPPAITNTALGTQVAQNQAAGQQAQSNLTGDRSAIAQTGMAANAQGQAVSAALKQQGQQAQNTAAPQMNVQGGGAAAQAAAGQAASSFKPNASGAAGVRQAGVDASQNIANVTNNYNPALQNAGREGAQSITQATQQGTGNLNNFQAATSGITALNNFANGPQGPSTAEALLRMQADRDKRTALSLARSARGGPAATALALRRAQAENAATAAETRGQASALRAQEAATARGQNLTALTSAGGLEQQASGTNLSALQSAGALGVQGATAAANTNLAGTQAAAQNAQQGAIASGQINLQGQTAATGAELQGSQQQLQGIQVAGDIANQQRTLDTAVAQSNLTAKLQTMGLNNQQQQFFTALGEQARQAGIQAEQNAVAQGASVDQAKAALTLQYGQQAYQMLSGDQQAQLQALGLQAGILQQQYQNSNQQTQILAQFLGTALLAGGTLFGGPVGAAAGAAANAAILGSTPAPNTQLTMPTISDKRMKTAIGGVKSLASELRQTPGSTYRYKNTGIEPGEHTGPMAQDLEQAPHFRSAVKNVGGVKMVDAARLTMAHHAALHDLQKQLDKVARAVKVKAA